MINSIFVYSSLFKAFQVVFTASIKFFFAPFLALSFGFDFIQIFFSVAFGGILGVLAFYILSEWFVEVFAKIKPRISFVFGGLYRREKKPKKIFTKRNRLIVKIIRTYGLSGIVVLTPVLFLPLGTFLAFRYFHHRENVLLYLSYSVIAWAFVLTVFVSFFQ